MNKRTLEDLEKAIDFVKKNGFEAAMPEEMVRANKMLLNLKRLKRLKDEILNLKQSTVAEIRSYGKPPTAVHTVMTSVYLLLGMKEKALKVMTCTVNIRILHSPLESDMVNSLKKRILSCQGRI